MGPQAAKHMRCGAEGNPFRAFGFLAAGSPSSPPPPAPAPPPPPPPPRPRFSGAAARSRSSKSAPYAASRSASAAAVTARRRFRPSQAVRVWSSTGREGICGGGCVAENKTRAANQGVSRGH